MAMNSALMNIGLSMGLVQVGRKIPFDDPAVLTYVRIGYVVAQVIVFGAHYYSVYAIKKKNDLKLLKYVESQNPMTQEPPQLVVQTVRDYDLAEVSKALRTAGMAVVMMCFLHFYMKYNPPLFVQGLLGVKGLYDARELKLHILNKPAEGDLKRPFKTAGGFFAPAPQTDTAAINEAEKKVGPRDEYI